jgi:trigger factor
VTDYTIWLGVDPILPEFHSNILGKHAGDVVTFPVTYGEDFSNKELAGKTVEFSVEIVSVERVILPEIDDEFAKDLEQETLDDLKKRIEDDLKVRLEHDIIEASKHEILMKLADANVFDLPPSLINEQKKNYPDREEEELTKMLRAGIILTKIQIQENIEVTDDEVDARIQHIATQNQVAVAAMRNYLAQQGGLERVRNDLLEAKTLDFLYEHANLKEEE